ncbi:MAG TPA: hypothetical protein VMX97_06725, partial [Hyphomicrobiaceae bacterium]|nr:hypothetical protein [Hyphomicrobiaceae bacterium]
MTCLVACVRRETALLTTDAGLAHSFPALAAPTLNSVENLQSTEEAARNARSGSLIVPINAFTAFVAFLGLD